MNLRSDFLIKLLFCLLIVSLIFNISNNISSHRIKKSYQGQLDDAKKNNQNAIKDAQKNIDSLLNDNKKKDLLIEQANMIIGILEKERHNITLKYITKYREIQKLSSEDIKRYWQHEFEQ